MYYFAIKVSVIKKGFSYKDIVNDIENKINGSIAQVIFKNPLDRENYLLIKSMVDIKDQQYAITYVSYIDTIDDPNYYDYCVTQSSISIMAEAVDNINKKFDENILAQAEKMSKVQKQLAAMAEVLNIINSKLHPSQNFDTEKNPKDVSPKSNQFFGNTVGPSVLTIPQQLNGTGGDFSGVVKSSASQQVYSPYHNGGTVLETTLGDETVSNCGTV